MGEMLCKIRTSQHGSDLLWKSEKHRRRGKTGDAVGRASWRSSFLGAPGAQFFAESGRSLDRRTGALPARKNFLGRGRRRPLPKIPCFPRRQEGNASYCKCAQENCLTEGVHPMVLRPFCAQALSVGVAA